MLVITRKYSERFSIGDDCIITVTRIDRGKVEIGIECPRDVLIMREELVPVAEFAEIEERAKGGGK